MGRFAYFNVSVSFRFYSFKHSLLKYQYNRQNKHFFIKSFGSKQLLYQTEDRDDY